MLNAFVIKRQPVLAAVAALTVATTALAQQAAPAPKSETPKSAPTAAVSTENSPERQTELEAKFSKMLSGATLEGSFTASGPGADAAKINREKYTLGEVKKVAGEIWQFPTRIQYGGKDITLPIPLPVRWAGDTPIVVVDEVSLPGFGTVSARVLFFDGHYAGYWKHGEHSGNLFGEIHSKEDKSSPPAADSKTPTSTEPAARPPK